MVLDVELVSKLCAPFLSGAAAWLVRKVRPPVRLVSYFGHISAFKVNPVAGSNDPPTLVHTHSVVVLNSGSKPAHNVRLTHAQLPENVTFYPTVSHEIDRRPDGSGEIRLPVLSPKEQVTISYLYFHPLVVGQINQTTKCDECLAKVLNAIPMPQPTTAVKYTVWGLMLMGACLVFYFVVKVALLLLL